MPIRNLLSSQGCCAGSLLWALEHAAPSGTLDLRASFLALRNDISLRRLYPVLSLNKGASSVFPLLPAPRVWFPALQSPSELVGFNKDNLA